MSNVNKYEIDDVLIKKLIKNANDNDGFTVPSGVMELINPSLNNLNSDNYNYHDFGKVVSQNQKSKHK